MRDGVAGRRHPSECRVDGCTASFATRSALRTHRVHAHGFGAGGRRPPPTEDDEAYARRLVDAGYTQVSAKHKQVRAPDGVVSRLTPGAFAAWCAILRENLTPGVHTDDPAA